MLASAVAVVVLSVRTYNSLVLLRNAQALGTPAIGKVRPWMTLGYVADSYQVGAAELVDGLGLPRNVDPNTSLLAIAVEQRLSPVAYMQQVQRALAGLIAAPRADAVTTVTSGPGTVGQQVLAAMLVYGYPVLGLTLMLGALGVPLPAGLATVVVGSLAASGKLDWTVTAVVALSASVIGDMAGYGLGRLVRPASLERRAGWLGYSATRRARVEALLARWGGLAVLLTRTLVSSLSAVVNLAAGAGRYRLRDFAVQALVGRLAWTSAYLAVGYVAGSDLDAASGFLLNLSLALIALAVFTGSGLAVLRRRQSS